ncbi:hypothetical protein IAT40_007046 [Kwoniella sp. CBS 6097]
MSSSTTQTVQAILLLPFTPSLLQNPTPLLPVIASTLTQSATQSFTVLFTTPPDTAVNSRRENEAEEQLYTSLKQEPIRHFATLQRFLCKVYTALVYAQMRAGRPLMDVEVHFDGEEGDYAQKLFRTKEHVGAGAGAGAGNGKEDIQVILAEGVSIPAHLRSLHGGLPTQSIPYSLQSPTSFLPPSYTVPNPSSTTSTLTQAPTPLPFSATTKCNAASYPVVALGGTFDHLHAAHKLLLHLALFLTTRKIIVGVMSDSLLGTKSDAGLVQKLPERLDEVQRFLLRLGGTYIGAEARHGSGSGSGSDSGLPDYTDEKAVDAQSSEKLGVDARGTIITTGANADSSRSSSGVEIAAAEITDALGPTRYDPNIQALVVSRETVSGGKSVNITRKEKGLGELDLWIVDVIGMPPPSTNQGNDVETITINGGVGLEGLDLDGVDDEKLIKEMKMGSTGIRRWIAEHSHNDARTGNGKEGEDEVNP